MISVEANASPQHAAATCPRCHSSDCQPNRFSNLSLGEVADTVWTAQRAGRPAQSLRALLAWASVELANALRDRWQCDFCQDTFR